MLVMEVLQKCDGKAEQGQQPALNLVTCNVRRMIEEVSIIWCKLSVRTTACLADCRWCNGSTSSLLLLWSAAPSKGASSQIQLKVPHQAFAAFKNNDKALFYTTTSDSTICKGSLIPAEHTRTRAGEGRFKDKTVEAFTLLNRRIELVLCAAMADLGKEQHCLIRNTSAARACPLTLYRSASHRQ